MIIIPLQQPYHSPCNFVFLSLVCSHPDTTNSTDTFSYSVHPFHPVVICSCFAVYEQVVHYSSYPPTENSSVPAQPKPFPEGEFPTAVCPWLPTGLSCSHTLKTQRVLLWQMFLTLHTSHTKIYRRAKTTRCMPNAMKSWAGVLGERKQLIGEQSTIPADPLSPPAGDRRCMALPVISSLIGTPWISAGW